MPRMSSKNRKKTDGTVTAYKTKSGKRYRWQAFVPENPFNPNGPKKRAGVGGFLTHKEADADMQAALVNVRANRLAVPGDTLFKDYAQQWFDGQNLANATLQGYEKIIRVHLIPNLGHMKLTDITGQVISRMYKSLLRNGNKGRTTKGQGLSSNSVSKIHILLGSILQDAYLEGKVKQNEARHNPRLVKAPTGKNIRQEQVELNTWNLEQMKAFLKWDREVANDDFYPLWHLFLFTGIRRGEGVALQWGDLNEANNTIVIRRAADSGTRKGVKITKTGKDRVIQVDTETMRILLGMKIERAKLGPKFVQGNAYVFGTLDGTIRNAGDVGERWSKTIAKARAALEGLPHLTIKGMRHTHATLLLQSGAKMKAVQERLGHSNITTTLDIYSHSTETMQNEAVQSFMENF